MDENLEKTTRLSRDEMRVLLGRRDGPALVLFVVQVAAFVAGCGVTLTLAAEGSSLRWLAVIFTGLVLLMFFPSMHEAGHGTAFRTPWMNRAATWVSAVLMLQAPTFFREFHFEHHRSTSDPAADPEISGAPEMLAAWPTNPFFWMTRAAGQHLMVGKAMFTLACALLPIDRASAAFFPFLRPALRRRVVWESRAVVLLLTAACGAGLAYVPGFATLLLAWPVAHVGLGLFVMPEHTGLPSNGSQLHRTRSTRSNALVRAAMWNMPWHAEHHAFPAVPFHALPALAKRVEPDLEHVAPGYLAFHAEALRRSFRRP